MRAIVQRVDRASVVVEDEIIGAIDEGLLVYLGIGRHDSDAEVDWLVDKIVALRIFENDTGKMDMSVLDRGGAMLVVSQFTLYADVRRGRRPGFEQAMPPLEAEPLYERFVDRARTRLRVETGRFRAEMRVSSDNRGPVTIGIDTADCGRAPAP